MAEELQTKQALVESLQMELDGLKVKTSRNETEITKLLAECTETKAALESEKKQKEVEQASAKTAQSVAKQALEDLRSTREERNVATSERNAAVSKLDSVKSKFEGMYTELDAAIQDALRRETVATTEAGKLAQDKTRLTRENVIVVTRLSEITQRNVELTQMNDKLTRQLAAIRKGAVPEVSNLLGLLKTKDEDKDKKQREEIAKLRGVVEAIGRIASIPRSSQPRDIEHLKSEINSIIHTE